MKDWRQLDYEGRRASWREDAFLPWLAEREPELPGTPKTVIAADWTTEARAPHAGPPVEVPPAAPASWWRRALAWLSRGF